MLFSLARKKCLQRELYRIDIDLSVPLPDYDYAHKGPT